MTDNEKRNFILARWDQVVHITMIDEATFTPRMVFRFYGRQYSMGFSPEKIWDLRAYGINIEVELKKYVVEDLIHHFPVAAFRAVKLQRILRETT